MGSWRNPENQEGHLCLLSIGISSPDTQVTCICSIAAAHTRSRTCAILCVWEPVCETQLVVRMMNKDDVIPVVQDDTLIYQRSGRDERLQVGTPAWHAWLSTVRSFAFRSASGTFTA